MHNEVGPRPIRNDYRLCRTQDISDTIISKEERLEYGQPHNHANHMLWGWERFYTNLQNFVPNRQVDSQWVLTIGPMSKLDESGLTTTPIDFFQDVKCLTSTYKDLVMWE